MRTVIGEMDTGGMVKPPMWPVALRSKELPEIDRRNDDGSGAAGRVDVRDSKFGNDGAGVGEVEQALVVARPEGAVAVVTGDEGAGVDVAGVGHPGVDVTGVQPTRVDTARVETARIGLPALKLPVL